MKRIERMGLMILLDPKNDAAQPSPHWETT